MSPPSKENSPSYAIDLVLIISSTELLDPALVLNLQTSNQMLVGGTSGVNNGRPGVT